MPFSLRLASQFRVYQFHRTIHDSLAGHHDHLVHPYRSCLPNFIVIGAAKSATTSLAEIFYRHNQIHFSSAKEPKFFGRNYERGWAWYAHFFEKGGHLPLRGEASTMYSSTSPAFSLTPQLIRYHLGIIKLIYLVRHPMQRIVSHWRHYKGRHLDCPEFNKLMESKMLRERIVGSSLYHLHLQRYLTVFPSEAIHCMTYEDLIDHPKRTLRAMFQFLDVQPQLRKVLKKGKIPSKNKAGTKGRSFVEQPSWPSALKEEVLSVIRPDAEQMLKFMGKPLTTWDWDA